MGGQWPDHTELFYDKGLQIRFLLNFVLEQKNTLYEL